ncbi:hypothetical protein [uncultured Desulfovibrio sp.]|uniref:hypothetical protein n=1 Tax=uncultured Desulfovibrio sp. TaxID=167968 RepID=UPI0026322330|nr:hypothetical protein [uncultured Desulfovibrio sp.]
MYNRGIIEKLVEFISSKDGNTDKSHLQNEVQEAFGLVKERSVYYCDWFAIRFCKSVSRSFGNTVLALSALHRYDNIPFIVCLVTPTRNYLMLANTTFLRKISHSSQELRRDNIKGSFNGSDIMREFEDVENIPDNFEFLYTSHENYTFEENLDRLVEATNNIAPTGKRFIPTESQVECIRKSVDRAISFLRSEEYDILNNDLNNRVSAVESEIAIAAFIDNVNLRGRIIEYLITAEDDLRATLMNCLRAGLPLPEIFTADKLGDYERRFEHYFTATDIKTKILFLSSNPKGYNIDKLLSFLSEEKSVYLVYIVAIDKDRRIQTRLCSMFNHQLLSYTRIIRHWAGRNSRGVTQYDGRALEDIVENFDFEIDYQDSQAFIIDCLNS